jgi:hypothetical protein
VTGKISGVHGKIEYDRGVPRKIQYQRGVHGKIEYDRGVLRKIKYVWSYLSKRLFLRGRRRLRRPRRLLLLVRAPCLLDGGEHVGLELRV